MEQSKGLGHRILLNNTSILNKKASKGTGEKGKRSNSMNRKEGVFHEQIVEDFQPHSIKKRMCFLSKN
jgi:hypothetical protein